tara:strand:+ start:669 stop:1163 length:495 start_codon:yes stop_codon:yes gene_type:complete
MEALTQAQIHEIRRNWYLRLERGFSKPVPMDIATTYFKALLVFARGDGILSAKERSWVVGFAALLGHSDEFLQFVHSYSADDNIDGLLEELSASQDAQRALLYDAICACTADGYHQQEQQRIHQVAKKLGVPDDVIARIEALVVAEQALTAEKREIFHNNQSPF